MMLRWLYVTFISYSSCTGHTSAFIFSRVLVYNQVARGDPSLDHKALSLLCTGGAGSDSVWASWPKAMKKNHQSSVVAVAHFFKYFRRQICVCVHTHMGHTRDKKIAATQRLSLRWFTCSCSGDLGWSSNPSLSGRLAGANSLQIQIPSSSWRERCTSFHALTPLPSRRDSALRESSAEPAADPLQSHFTARKPK